jgi:Flp pilus assembly protein TadD
LQLKPDYVGAQVNFGITLGLAGRQPEAVACFEAALQLDPDSFEAHVNLANSLTRIGRLNEAIVQYEAALRLRPGDAAVRDSLRRARAEMH